MHGFLAKNHDHSGEPGQGRCLVAVQRLLGPALFVGGTPFYLKALLCGLFDAPPGGWDAIPAVRDNRIVEIKSPIILQPGPAALTDGLDAIVKALWP